MNMIFWLFSFLCAQDATRSFAIAGYVLPLCQRCTGVYLGLALSSLFLGLSGYHRRVLPPRSILYANIAALLVMPVFGFHLLDPGPLWRLWSGLIFGNSIAFLAVPAAFILVHGGRICGRHTPGSTARYWTFYVLLHATPLAFSIPSEPWYYVVLVLSCAGVCCVLVPVTSAAVFLCVKCVVLFSPWEIRPWVRRMRKRWAIARPASP